MTDNRDPFETLREGPFEPMTTLYVDGLDLAARDEPGLRKLSPAELELVIETLEREFGRIDLVRGYVAGVRIVLAEMLESSEPEPLESVR